MAGEAENHGHNDENTQQSELATNTSFLSTNQIETIIQEIVTESGVAIDNIAKTSTSGLVDTYTITMTNEDTYTFTVTNGQDGADGTDGTDGRGIVSIIKTSTSGLVDTYTITYTNNTTSTFTVTNGAKGDPGTPGRGIVSITKTAYSGLVDTYTITYTDNTTSTFEVTNGRNVDGNYLGNWNDSTYYEIGDIVSYSFAYGFILYTYKYISVVSNNVNHAPSSNLSNLDNSYWISMVDTGVKTYTDLTVASIIKSTVKSTNYINSCIVFDTTKTILETDSFLSTIPRIYSTGQTGEDEIGVILTQTGLSGSIDEYGVFVLNMEPFSAIAEQAGKDPCTGYAIAVVAGSQSSAGYNVRKIIYLSDITSSGNMFIAQWFMPSFEPTSAGWQEEAYDTSTDCSYYGFDSFMPNRCVGNPDLLNFVSLGKKPTTVTYSDVGFAMTDVSITEVD